MQLGKSGFVVRVEIGFEVPLGEITMYRYRRPWGGRNMFWLLFIPMFFFFGHWGFGFFAWLFLMMAIVLIIRGAARVWSNSAPTYQQPYQPYQQQQPNDYYYRPTNENPYPSYQEGYEAQSYRQSQGQDVRDVPSQQVAQQDERYEQYEQPQAQYPQELPPMQ